MIIRLIFIVITTLLSNSLLASSNNTTWEASLSGDDSSSIHSVFIPGIEDKLLFDPIGSADSQTSTADSQTNSGEECQTFEPGKEPPVTVWTLFPGSKSNVDKPTLITCKTATQLALQHLVAKGCSKGV